MTRSSVIARAAVGILLLGRAVFAQSQPTVEPRNALEPPRLPKMALDLPEPIKEFDLGRVGDYLGLAAPQRLFLKEAHARYLKDIEAVRRQTQPQLDAACEHSLMVQGNDRRTFAAVASIAQVYDVEESLRRAIERADEALFVELESVLADVQKPGMARVRDYRQRQACVGWLRWLVRPARIDLSAMLDDVSAVPEVRAAVDGLLADYERRLTPTRVALNKAMLANRIRLLELSAWLVRDENDRPLDPTLLRQRSQEHALRVSALLDDSVRLQRQIADLNQKTLGTLLTAMPPSVATSLRNEYQRRAFPTVYPDPHGLHDVCERLVGAAASTMLSALRSRRCVPRTNRSTMASIWKWSAATVTGASNSPALLAA